MAVPKSRGHDQSRELLQDWLAQRLPHARDVRVTSLTSPRIGYSAETLIFDAEWCEGRQRRRQSLVARIRPSGYAMFPDVDLGLHYAVLRALAGTGVPAPNPRWFQPEENSPFGEPFFVMDRVAGEVPPEHPAYTAGGWVADAPPAQQNRIYRSAIEKLARVHTLDWRSLDVDFLPAVAGGEPGMRTEVKRFEEYLYWVLDGTTCSLFEDTLDCLRTTVPTADRLCLNWGDPKFSNIIYRGTTPVGLLDWELATVAPPENDVAFFLTYHDSITRALGHPELPGFLSDEQAVALYEEVTGTELNELGYYRLWHLFRLAVMALRLTRLLVISERLPPASERAPHHVPMRLLQAALDSR